ncbi:MAG: hypothetical protein LBH07_06795 [Treponema sp.]|jgi:hypothetical protein|nr:hypothetical protein [Treponema sp.]
MVMIVPEICSQQAPRWSLLNAKGNIILTRSGRRLVYQDGISGPAGIIQLGAQDMVQTGNGTASLMLESRGTTPEITLMLKENSYVVLEKLEDGVSLEFLYGRIRIISSGALSVKTGNSITQLLECDVALDYIARPGVSQPGLVLHCFKAAGELTARSFTGSEGVKLQLKTGESLSLEYQMPFAYVERKNLDSAAMAIWDVKPPAIAEAEFANAGSEDSRRDISSAAPGSPGGNPGSSGNLSNPGRSVNPGNPGGSSASSRNTAPKPPRKNISKTVSILGVSLMGAGVGLQSYVHFSDMEEDLSKKLFYTAYAPIGVGAILVLGAAFINLANL